MSAMPSPSRRALPKLPLFTLSGMVMDRKIQDLSRRLHANALRSIRVVVRQPIHRILLEMLIGSGLAYAVAQHFSRRTQHLVFQSSGLTAPFIALRLAAQGLVSTF
jgi:hypothetical protein